MTISSEISRIYAFGNFRLEATERRLCQGETQVGLTPKTFDLLLFLVENDGRLLGKSDLLAVIWPDAAVEENNLTVAVSALRRALGESGEHRYIETVPKRGYRFVAPVTKLQVESSATETQLAPAPVPPSSETHNGIASRYQWVLIAVLIGAVTFLGWFAFQKRPLPRHEASTPRHLAILPFRNLRGDAEDQFLALSLADAVITRLGSIHRLVVRPSCDIQKYRHGADDLPKIAADLRVEAILTGTFIHEEDNLRVSGQLIDVKTHNVLWNGGFDVKYNKLLTVQEKVAYHIVRGLALTLSPSEAATLRADETIDPLAYEYYLRGIDLYAQNDFQLASKVLEKSLEMAPDYAPSWAHLGRAYTASASFQFGGGKMYRKAEMAFARAIAIQPDAIDARVYMANMFTDSGRVEKAVPLLRQTIGTNPRHAESHWELGYAYRFAGMLEQSVAECERARQLDPAVKLYSSALNSYLYLGRYDRFLASLPKGEDRALMVFYRGLGEYCRKDKAQATADFDRAFELDRSMLQAGEGKALSCAIRHQYSEARALLRDLENKTDSRGAYDPEALYKIAQAYAVSGDKASALRVLRRSIENGFFPYPYFLTDPLLDNVRAEPQFSALMDIARDRHRAFQRMYF